MNPPILNIMDQLLPYQQRWLKKPAHFKIGLWAARQARTTPPPPKPSRTASFPPAPSGSAKPMPKSEIALLKARMLISLLRCAKVI